MTDSQAFPEAVVAALDTFRSWLPRMLSLWAGVSLVGVAALAIGMAMRDDLPKIIGLAVLLGWVPMGAVFAGIGFQKRRGARLLESFAMDRTGVTKARFTGTHIVAEHRDGRRLEISCVGMPVRDVLAIVDYLSGN